MNIFRSILQYNHNLKNDFSKSYGVTHHTNSSIKYEKELHVIDYKNISSKYDIHSLEYSNGIKIWHKYDKLHRLNDKPALVSDNLSYCYFKFGKQYQNDSYQNNITTLPDDYNNYFSPVDTSRNSRLATILFFLLRQKDNI